ncbi:PACE efflux transporter [Pseudomonas sp. LP_7_YM]|uniref:PACE efflux transporter n=1 Tax=Pseudomonas sp. LP_7_YM TaxID=2485137 RepID=UPI00105FE4D7|nr:PACE efflux transporter [Pseudomonas sp. LP_7_YM]TDV70275.1 putative membrane protein [Pseudomonas sp. LP_7_YM]
MQGTLQGRKRKLVQAILYETIAIAVLSPVISLAYDDGLAHAGALSLMLSTSALCWNVLYNYLFEYWESRQIQRTRTLARRLLHSFGFEGGLVLMLVPLVAWWLNISWWAALITNLGLFVFFFFYALLFQWLFDRVFGVPTSAQACAN